jgi:hypothetical protein
MVLFVSVYRFLLAATVHNRFTYSTRRAVEPDPARAAVKPRKVLSLMTAFQAGFSILLV